MTYLENVNALWGIQPTAQEDKILHLSSWVTICSNETKFFVIQVAFSLRFGVLMTLNHIQVKWIICCRSDLIIFNIHLPLLPPQCDPPQSIKLIMHSFLPSLCLAHADTQSCCSTGVLFNHSFTHSPSALTLLLWWKSMKHYSPAALPCMNKNTTFSKVDCTKKNIPPLFALLLSFPD